MLLAGETFVRQLRFRLRGGGRGGRGEILGYLVVWVLTLKFASRGWSLWLKICAIEEMNRVSFSSIP